MFPLPKLCLMLSSVLLITKALHLKCYSTLAKDIKGWQRRANEGSTKTFASGEMQVGPNCVL